MKITLCVDSLALQVTGIGRYCWELANGLSDCETVEELLYHRSGLGVRDIRSLVSETAAPPRRSLKMPRRCRKWLFRQKARGSLFHGPNYFLPDWVEHGVITVHDLSVLRFPETHPAERVRHFEEKFQSSLDRASHLITDSEWNRAEVVEMLGVSADRVSAVPLGVGDNFAPLEEGVQVDLPVGLRRRGFGLCVATFEPRKRLLAAVKAWSILPGAVRDRFPLVVAGGHGWCNDEMKVELQRAQEEGWLINLGYVPERSLPALYASAHLFLFPSIYEGFGLPPIEAMACGTPCIVSNSACLPEVTKGAAMLVNPDDTEGFSHAIEQCLTDDRWRETARSEGLRVAAGYRWKRCVEATADIYHAVGGWDDDLVANRFVAHI